jgi:chromosome segregation ATPase
MNKQLFNRVADIAKEQPRVELASFENEKEKFKQKAKQIFNEVDNTTAKYRDAVDEIRSLKKEIVVARKMMEDLEMKANKAKAAFNDLGIDPPMYLYEIDGVGFLGWTNDLIEMKQILEQYDKN